MTLGFLWVRLECHEAGLGSLEVVVNEFFEDIKVPLHLTDREVLKTCRSLRLLPNAGDRQQPGIALPCCLLWLGRVLISCSSRTLCSDN
jgi:hypothetical protein